jgi:hypothetical protein
MTTSQLEFTADELLADEPIEEPLIVDGVRCHGGFDDGGTYVSPRTKYRWPAIHAWEEQRTAQFGTPILDIPLATWPENFPNVEQSKFLIGHGTPEPTITALTRIGTVEGFGVLLRSLAVPDFSRCFEEDVAGTAIDHISGGLFEAHARDEAGFGDAAGHDQMWFVARDIAFEHPSTEDMKTRMLRRMGIDSSPRSAAQIAQARQAAQKERLLPEDVDFALETLVARMVGLLLIEISAFHGFAWAEAVLGDTDLVAGDGAAAQIVSFIRSDETPHVAWLRTALSEMRDRTWVGAEGRTYPGVEMIGRVWDRAVADSLGVRRQDNIRFVLEEIEHALDGRPDGRAVMEEMLALGSVVPAKGGSTAAGDAPSPY